MDNRNLNVSHFAWCGLVALQNARKDGQVSSPAQENLLLVRWLALAKKQRRFQREFAEDICWLLRTGRNRGVHADLPGKLNCPASRWVVWTSTARPARLSCRSFLQLPNSKRTC
ncbi:MULTISPECIES: DUF2913 family protein [Erwiniaceae]|uniref:DUF2913 family protein n=1 Tax=Erwiniaceae TaxID=1903409 RepID=UPI00351BEF60